MKYFKKRQADHNNLPLEDIYGHRARLEWILSHIGKGDKIVEFGCGTGYMIVIPLLRNGYNCTGVDLDEKSIAYGKNLLKGDNLDADKLVCADIRDLAGRFDVIIASEVLEHINDNEIGRVLSLLSSKLGPQCKLLVTVPNGYGWFELESFLWFKLGLGRFLERTKIARRIIENKQRLFGNSGIHDHPSTLSSSPHVQRFTYRSIRRLLESNGFHVNEIVGAPLFSGPLSNLLFTAVKPIMWFNRQMGRKLPWIAGGYYVSCTRSF